MDLVKEFWETVKKYWNENLSISWGDTKMVDIPAWVLILGWYAYSGGWKVVMDAVKTHLM